MGFIPGIARESLGSQGAAGPIAGKASDVEKGQGEGKGFIPDRKGTALTRREEAGPIARLASRVEEG